MAGTIKYQTSQDAYNIGTGGINFKKSKVDEILLLNAFPGSILGLSLKLLDNNYTGNCVNVRNDDDDELV
jgi:hypothetical protein